MPRLTETLKQMIDLAQTNYEKPGGSPARGKDLVDLVAARGLIALVDALNEIREELVGIRKEMNVHNEALNAILVQLIPPAPSRSKPKVN